MFLVNIIKANAAIKELTAKIEELTADNANLLKAVEDSKQREAVFSLSSHDWMTEKENLVKGHEEAMVSLRADFDKQITELNAKLAETKVSVNQEASKIVASLGVEPETIKVEPKALTPNDILATFQALQGTARQTFYQENKETIVKALGLDK